MFLLKLFLSFYEDPFCSYSRNKVSLIGLPFDKELILGFKFDIPRKICFRKFFPGFLFLGFYQDFLLSFFQKIFLGKKNLYDGLLKILLKFLPRNSPDVPSEHFLGIISLNPPEDHSGNPP